MELPDFFALNGIRFGSQEKSSKLSVAVADILPLIGPVAPKSIFTVTRKVERTWIIQGSMVSDSSDTLGPVAHTTVELLGNRESTF